MSTCKTCGAYYKLSVFHSDPSYCEDCDGVTNFSDEERDDIESLVNPTGKTAIVRYDDDSER